jgi:hypothetical protein
MHTSYVLVRFKLLYVLVCYSSLISQCVNSHMYAHQQILGGMWVRHANVQQIVDGTLGHKARHLLSKQKNL